MGKFTPKERKYLKKVAQFTGNSVLDLAADARKARELIWLFRSKGLI